MIKKLIPCLLTILAVSTFSPIHSYADWKQDNKGWWYSEENSHYATGWKNINNEWYLFDSSGYMMTGWVKTDNNWFYLKESGAMAHDCTIDGFTLDSNGYWIQNKDALKEATETSTDTTTVQANYDMKKYTIKGPKDSEMNYWLYTPQNPENKKMPLIVYLHGYWGEDSTIDDVIKNDGLPKYVYDKTVDIPAYVLCPDQLDFELLKDLINDLVSKNNINPDKISLTGHSMGGTQTWVMASFCPDLFSCIVPVSSFINAEYISKDTWTSDIPVYIIVGDKDTTIDPKLSLDAGKKINELYNSVKIKEFKDADHIATESLAYLDKDADTLNWMLSQTKKKH